MADVLNTASTHHSPDKDELCFEENETCNKKERTKECVEAFALVKKPTSEITRGLTSVT